MFSKNGVRPNPLKLQEIKQTPVPEDAKALRIFLGLVNYFKRFIPNYSTLTYPLRSLLRNDTKYVWNPEAQTCFDNLKNSLTSDSCTAYFDEKKPIYVYTDASPVGVLCILVQMTDAKEPKTISYSSQALTLTEQKYSQLERECLSIVYACEHNKLYLFGTPFTIFNDHQAIVTLLNDPKSTIPLRIERMTLRLQRF